MQYQEILPLPRSDAQAIFEGGNRAEIGEALVRVAYHDPDWRWVQAQCLRFARHPDPGVRGLAATCLGHLARIHGDLDQESVLPVLQKLLQDPEVAGRAEDALDDIALYLGKK